MVASALRGLLAQVLIDFLKELLKLLLDWLNERGEDGEDVAPPPAHL